MHLHRVVDQDDSHFARSANVLLFKGQAAVFDEVQAAKGCLGFLKGEEVLLTLLNYADRAVLYGHQLGGIVRPYFPLDYSPFKLKP